MEANRTPSHGFTAFVTKWKQGTNTWKWPRRTFRVCPSFLHSNVSLKDHRVCSRTEDELMKTFRNRTEEHLKTWM